MTSVTYITISQQELEAVAFKAASLALLKAARQTGEQMTLREVADHFGITTNTVREWERLGKIPLRKNGRWAKAEILGR